MKPEVFLKNIDLVSKASNGIESLRAYIFRLAIEGKLVEQIPGEESAEILLSKIISEKEKITKKGKPKDSKTKAEIIVRGKTLPKGWVLTSLAESGFVNPRNYLDDSLEVSFIPMKLIPEGFSRKAIFKVRKWKDVKTGFTHIASNDVVMAKITPCFQNRKSIVLKNLKNGFGAGTTELHVFRAFPDTILPEYILLFLKSANFINLGIPKMTGSAGQKRVPNDYFSFTPIPLPPREEQKRIVAKVEQLMVLCDELEAKQETQTHTKRKLNDAALNSLFSASSPYEFEMQWRRIISNFDLLYDDLDNLQFLRQTIMQIAVQGKLVEQKMNNESGLTFLKNFIKKYPPLKISEIPFFLPKGWAWERLGNICSYLQRGKSPEYIEKGEYPVVSQKCVQWSGFDISRARFINPSSLEKYEEDRFLKPGDLLWNSTGDGTIGRINIYSGENNPFKRVVADSHVTILRLNGLEPRFVYTYLASPYIQNKIAELSSGTTKQTELNTSTIRMLPVPVAPLEEQSRIVAKVDQLTQLCNEIEEKYSGKSNALDKFVESLLRV